MEKQEQIIPQDILDAAKSYTDNALKDTHDEYIKEQLVEVMQRDYIQGRMEERAAKPVGQYSDEDMINAFNSGREGFGGGMKRKVYTHKSPYEWLANYKPTLSPTDKEIEDAALAYSQPWRYKPGYVSNPNANTATSESLLVESVWITAIEWYKNKLRNYEKT